MNLYYISIGGLIKINSIRELIKYTNLVFSNDSLYNTSVHTKLFYYCDHNNNSIYIADSIKLLSQVTDLILDEELVFFQKNVGFIFAPYTIYKNIYRIPTKVKIALDEINSSLSFERIKPSIDNIDVNIDTFENKLSKALLSKIGTNNCILHGGGADSSLLVALCKKNDVKCETLTCVMTGMEEESLLAKQISEKKGFNCSIHNTDKTKSNIILNNYIEDNYEVVADPIMPIIKDMVNNLENKTIIDGQGADSLLLAIPNVRLIYTYNFLLSLLLRFPVKLLNGIKIDKSSKKGRKLYRIKKALLSLSAKDIVDCLLISWNFPIVENSQYLNYVRSELKGIFKMHKDKYKMFIYICLNCLLPVREIQKYEGLEEKGIKTNLPFLDDEFVNYIYKCKTSDLFDGKNIKKPVYTILAKELPGFIKKNNTKPFFVNYFELSNSELENIYENKKYPIVDNTNFEFTSYNITRLKRILGHK